MTKDQLRKEYKQSRNSLSITEKSTMNDSIFENLKQLDWNKYSYVHVYLTLERFNEPDTTPFIKWMREFHQDVNLVISKSDFVKGEMENYILDNKTQLEENKWGILEPVSGVLIEESKIDLVLVPLLVIDRRGNRVGYGKGFYDRFLQKCRTDIQSYGISYFEPIDSIEDIGEWDIPLSGCITPSKVYSFQ